MDELSPDEGRKLEHEKDCQIGNRHHRCHAVAGMQGEWVPVAAAGATLVAACVERAREAVGVAQAAGEQGHDNGHDRVNSLE